MKRVLTIIAYLLGIFVFFALIFLIIYFFSSKDNRPNVKRDAETFIYTAQIVYYSDAIKGIKDQTICYDISKLNYLNHGLVGKRASDYKGSILINGDSNKPTIEIWLSDGESYAQGKINNISVEYSKDVAPIDCNIN